MVAVGFSMLLHVLYEVIKCEEFVHLMEDIFHAVTVVHHCIMNVLIWLIHSDRELLKLLQEEYEALPVALTAEVALGSIAATTGL